MLQTGTPDRGLPTAWDAGCGGGAELKQVIRDVEDEPEGPGEEGVAWQLRCCGAVEVILCSS